MSAYTRRQLISTIRLASLLGNMKPCRQAVVQFFIALLCPMASKHVAHDFGVEFPTKKPKIDLWC